MECYNYFQKLLSLMLISKAGRDALEEEVHLFQCQLRRAVYVSKILFQFRIVLYSIKFIWKSKKKQTSSSFLFLKAIHFCKKSVFVLMGSLHECAEIFRSFSSISVSIFKFHTAYLNTLYQFLGTITATITTMIVLLCIRFGKSSSDSHQRCSKKKNVKEKKSSVLQLYLKRDVNTGAFQWILLNR